MLVSFSHFKVNDFGLASTFDQIEFTKRFANLACPWYHPIFKAIATIDNKNVAKCRLQKRHASLIDRYAFLGLVFQLGLATGASNLLPESYKQMIKGDILNLMIRLRRPPPFGPTNPPTNQREQRLVKQRTEFNRQSDKWNLRNIQHFRETKSKGAEAFCVQVRKYDLYILKGWPGIFDAVVKWAWAHTPPRNTTSILDFLESKRPAPIRKSTCIKPVSKSQFTTRVKRKR